MKSTVSSADHMVSIYKTYWFICHNTSHMPIIPSNRLYPPVLYTRSNATALTKDTITCFICESDKLPLHQVCTLGVDARVRECASVLNDEKLLALLSSGDLIALEAHYHGSCLSNLYRNAEYAKRDDVPDSEQPHRLEGIALAELVSFIEESRGIVDDLPIFKLADLARMYKNRLEQLGVESTTRVNTTRLKECLVFQVPELESYSEGHGAYLAFRENIGQALHKLHKEDYDDEAIHLAKAASIVRKDILANKYTFNGSFEQSQLSSVPPSL